jgi:NAD(P)-dependent dehydrogenase (short-subunit alcohol dehydrogenase family)
MPGDAMTPATRGKVAPVTGANKGIGFETARQLARLGMTVLLGSRDEGRGREAAGKLCGEGLAVEAVRLDVTNGSDRAAVAERIASRFGRLDVLVNNAGICEPFGTRAAVVADEVLRRTFETNFFAVVALTRELLPMIRRSESGRIVNVSSQLGSMTLNSDGRYGDHAVPAYNASKAALNMYTVLLANELRDTPIKVNAAHPGWVRTDLGTDAAPLDATEGARTSVRLATLGPDGPTGGFFHLDERMPW